MKEITLKLDDDVHKAFKAYCASIGVTMQHWLDTAVRREVDLLRCYDCNETFDSPACHTHKEVRDAV